MKCKCCGAWFSSSDASQELCAACRRALARVRNLFENAVEVVRCKDCKRWGTGDPIETAHGKVCEFAGWFVGGNGYCVYGERKKQDVNT